MGGYPLLKQWYFVRGTMADQFSIPGFSLNQLSTDPVIGCSEIVVRGFVHHRRNWREGQTNSLYKRKLMSSIDYKKLLLPYYVWRFLYQNFGGLGLLVCLHHKIEVPLVVRRWKAVILCFLKKFCNLICSYFWMIWATDARWT